MLLLRLPALQRSRLAQLGGTMTAEAFVDLFFCIDLAVACVCQWGKLIDQFVVGTSSTF